MLNKLALRNVKRSVKDYIIYMITITLALSLTYALNLVSWSDAVNSISDGMNSFKQAIIFVNIIVIFVICFLINYTIKFMFEKRSKEFGTYMLLGIKKKKITQMFLLENIFLGLIALVLSIPIGFIMSQFISLIIIHILNLPQTIFIEFNLMSFILLIVYFLIIYALVLFIAYRRIKKISIYDLLYLEKQNEEKAIKTKKHRTIIFILSLLLGILAFIIWNSRFDLTLTYEGSVLTYLLLGIILFIISMYGFMFSISDFLLSLVLKNKKLKYTKDNLFVARTFSSKMRTMGFTLGTLGLLIMFTLLSLNLSSLNKGVYDYSIETSTPFDVSIMAGTKENAQKYLEVIKEDYHILNSVEYDIYLDSNSNIDKLLPAHSYKSNPADRIIKLSDYNKLLEMKGKPTITLNDNEYLLVIETSLNYLKDEKDIKTITLENGSKLNQKDVTNNLFFYGLSNEGHTIIVPDINVVGLDTYETFLSVDTKEETTSDLENKIINQMKDILCETNGATKSCETYRISVRGTSIESANIMTAMISAICIYMAFIFSATAGTILAITSLSESTKYKYRYQVLSRLGIKEENLYKTVRKQLYITFAIPVIYPIIISFGTIYSINKIYKYLLTSDYTYLIYFFGSLIIFLIIYLIYFIGTYFGYKRNIQKS